MGREQSGVHELGLNARPFGDRMDLAQLIWGLGLGPKLGPRLGRIGPLACHPKVPKNFVCQNFVCQDVSHQNAVRYHFHPPRGMQKTLCACPPTKLCVPPISKTLCVRLPRPLPGPCVQEFGWVDDAGWVGGRCEGVWVCRWQGKWG